MIEPNRPLKRSSETAAERTLSTLVETRSRATCSSACARVIGMSAAISPTRDEKCSISRRSDSLSLPERRRTAIMSTAAMGTVSTKTTTKLGTRMAVETRAADQHADRRQSDPVGLVERELDVLGVAHHLALDDRGARLRVEADREQLQPGGHPVAQIGPAT